MKVLILGATGLVGSNTLEQCFANPSITEVIAPTRRALPPRAKLTNPVAEALEAILPEVTRSRADAVICAMGTTMAKAKSKEAFRRVDYLLPVLYARGAHEEGAEICALVTAVGASVDSPFFYARTKGEVERDVKLIGFKSLTIFRPLIIGGDRTESRLTEGLVLWFSGLFAPILPKRFHVNPASKIASAILETTMEAEPGCHYRYAESLV